MNEFGDKDRIRIEFYLTRTESLKVEDALVKSPFIETHPTIFKVYSLEDLMARKFVALYNRMEGKDIYDLFYCLDLDFDKEDLFKALNIMLDFYRISQPGFLDDLLLRLEDARENSYYIANSTNHFIPRNLRPDWKIFIDTLILKTERTSYTVAEESSRKRCVSAFKFGLSGVGHVWMVMESVVWLRGDGMKGGQVFIYHG